MKVVFVMRHLGYVRLFDAPIRALLDRGHHVHLLYERDVWTDRELAWLRELEELPSFTASHTDALRRDRWFVVADRVRRSADYVHFLGPEFEHRESLVEQAAHRVHPRGVRELLRLLSRSEGVRRAIWRLLATVEDAIPPSVAMQDELRGLGAELLVIVPHLVPGNRQSEYVRAGAAAGVPSVVCVASWDNLTNKQLLRELPDRLVVWNDVQKREAVERHGMRPERVVVTGVQSFDEWFERSPRPREEFLGLVGLDPGKRYLLWVGGALFPAVLTEAQFVADEWLPRLRADERFADVQVLVRPHPRRLEEWEGFDAAAVWPRVGGAMPVDEESRADYFDSIYHSAAVAGINTTAMIEAAVVGRAVHTLLVPEFESSQLGTSHFEYLLTIGGGVLEAAETWPEHLDLLARSLAGDAAADERRRGFVREFVRPAGLDEPALPRFVEALETATVQPHAPTPGHVVLLRRAFTGALAGARTLVRALRSRP